LSALLLSVHEALEVLDEAVALLVGDLFLLGGGVEEEGGREKKGVSLFFFFLSLIPLVFSPPFPSRPNSKPTEPLTFENASSGSAPSGSNGTSRVNGCSLPNDRTLSLSAASPLAAESAAAAAPRTRPTTRRSSQTVKPSFSQKSLQVAQETSLPKTLWQSSCATTLACKKRSKKDDEQVIFL
jgi:hypothetical protein